MSQNRKIKRRPTIGLLFNDLFQDYEYILWKNLINIAEEKDINIIGVGGGTLNSPDYYLTQKNKIFDLITNKTVDGIIGLCASITNFVDNEQKRDFFNNFSHIPFISIGLNLENISCIKSENEIASYNLVSHLIEKHNVKKIAYIKGPENNPESIERLNGYKKALTDHNLKIDKNYIFGGSYDWNSGRNAVLTFLNHRKIQFDSLVSSNDLMALGAISELQKLNFNIPRDIKIAGFDNIQESMDSDPPLTTVSQPFYEISELAIKNILKLINKEEIENLYILPTRITIRHSCGCDFPRNIEIQYLNEKYNLNIDKKEKDENYKKNILKKFNETIQANFSYLDKRLNDNKWQEKLLDIILSENNKKDIYEFNKELIDIIITTLKKDFDTFTWYEIISLFFIITQKYSAQKLNIKYINDLWHNIFRTIGISEERYQKSIKERNEKFSTILYLMNRGLTTIFKKDQIQHILKDNIPKLDMNSCYISLYKNGNPDLKLSKLFFQYNNKAPNLKLSTEYYNMEYLIPGGLKNKKDRFSYILMPIFFKDEQLGFGLFEICTMYGKAYEILAIQLSSAIKTTMFTEELKNYTTSLEKKVKQRTLELESANQQKTRFFINLAHETKTPLTLIKNYLDKYISKKGIDEDLNIIKNNIDKLLHDMVNFMDAEKLNRAQIFYNNEQIIDFSDFLKNKVLLFTEIAQKKNIKIKTNIKNDIYTKLDPSAADRILNNIIDNSIKYTNNKGTISVDLNNKSGNIILTISDTGIGIKKENLKNIFDPYNQLSHKKRNIQGIGMGLFIVKKILDSVNGEISVESEKDKGTIFTIKLLEKEIDKKLDQITPAIISNPIDITSNTPELKEMNIKAGKQNILIVEDNIQTLIFLQTTLMEKYNVFIAKNGKEALEKKPEMKTPDLIISDIMMDEMNGHEFYNEISKDEDYEDVPFIFLTAKSTLEEKINGLKKGAIDYIFKPFIVEELEARIDSLIKNKMKQRKKNINMIEHEIYNALKGIDTHKHKKTQKYIKYKEFHEEFGITKREKDVMELLLQGLFNKEISDKLNISIRTVEFHIHNIYKKLNVQNKIEFMSIIKKYT